jgi:hypothetical protein
MNSKTKEVNVEDLLNSVDNNGSGANKSSNAASKKTNDTWIEEEETGFAFDVGKETKSSAKTKTNKKKPESKGWAKEPEIPEKEEPVAEITPPTETTAQPKKKMFVKPTGGAKATATVAVDEGDFPSIGEEAKPSSKHSEYTSQQQSQQSSTGPKRFVNAKKNNQGESFAPIDPSLAKEPEIIPPKIVATEKNTSRRKICIRRKICTRRKIW